MGPNFHISDNWKNVASSSEINQIIRSELHRSSDMKYIGGCTTQQKLMSMNGNFFSHFIDHWPLLTWWLMKLLKAQVTYEVNFIL